MWVALVTSRSTTRSSGVSSPSVSSSIFPVREATLPPRLHDRDLVLDGARVVRPDLRPEAILERRDDPSAARVVLGVGAGHHEQVERQAEGETRGPDGGAPQEFEHADRDG